MSEYSEGYEFQQMNQEPFQGQQNHADYALQSPQSGNQQFNQNGTFTPNQLSQDEEIEVQQEPPSEKKGKSCSLLLFYKIFSMIFAILSCLIVIAPFGAGLIYFIIKKLTSTVAKWVFAVPIVVVVVIIALTVLTIIFIFLKRFSTLLFSGIIFILFFIILTLVGIYVVGLCSRSVNIIGYLWNPSNFQGVYPLLEEKFNCCGYNSSYPEQSECSADSTTCKAKVEDWFTKYKYVGIGFIVIGVADLFCAILSFYFAKKLRQIKVEPEPSESIKEIPVEEEEEEIHEEEIKEIPEEEEEEIPEPPPPPPKKPSPRKPPPPPPKKPSPRKPAPPPPPPPRVINEYDESYSYNYYSDYSA